MTKNQWDCFSSFRDQFKKQIDDWSFKYSNELTSLQFQCFEQFSNPLYPLETPIVYNKLLDDFNIDSEIKLIVIGDNPGKDEQLAKNNRYLVGLSGKIADGFFRKHPDFGIDFRSNVIILNKTPIHTAKTKQLQFIEKNGSPAIKELIYESQKWMAEKTAELHQVLSCPLWLVGYSELKSSAKNAVFSLYRDTFAQSYKDIKSNKMLSAWDDVKVFQHFSMNRFSIDLANYESSSNSNKIASAKIESTLIDSLNKLGRLHRDEIFSL